MHAQSGRLWEDVQASALARWRLALLEFQAALASLRRLVVGWAIALVLLAVAISVGTVAAAETLAIRTTVDRAQWLLFFASVFSAVAGACAWAAWRQFRQRFTGLEQTLGELREDLAWIRSVIEHFDAQKKE